MRRATGLALVALGAFAIVIGPMTKWYLAPQLAKAPLGTFSTSDAVSDGRSSVLDRGTLSIRTGLTLTTHRRIQGDAAAGNDRRAVWDQFVYTTDADGHVIAATQDRIPFDRVSGTTLDCCGAATDGKPVTRSGLYFKFPFDTQRTDYPYYEEDTGKAWPAAYQGEERRLGLTMYTFHQQVPATKVESLQVPASLVNRSGGGAVAVDRFVESTTDLSVEPVTGIIVAATNHTVQTLRDAGGTTLATIADITSSLTDATQRSSADQASTAITQLRLIRTIVPVAAVVLGAVLVVVGLVLLGALAPVRLRRPDLSGPLPWRRRPAAP